MPARLFSFLPVKGRAREMPLQLREMRLSVKGRISLEEEVVVKRLSSLSLPLPLPHPQRPPQSPAGRFMAWISEPGDCLSLGPRVGERKREREMERGAQ